jgi:hypothetical protein
MVNYLYEIIGGVEKADVYREKQCKERLVSKSLILAPVNS